MRERGNHRRSCNLIVRWRNAGNIGRVEGGGSRRASARHGYRIHLRRSRGHTHVYGYRNRRKAGSARQPIVARARLVEAVPSRARHAYECQAEQERIGYLEQKIQRKDEVLAELMGEHIALKKSLGAL